MTSPKYSLGKRDINDFSVTHISLEMETGAWMKLRDLCIERYGGPNKKSFLIRVMLNAVLNDLVDIDELHGKLETIANKTEDVMYL